MDLTAVYPREMPSDQNRRCFHQEGIQALHCLREIGAWIRQE